MIRNIGAVLAGLVVWIIVASILDRLLRAELSGYAAALPTMQFTLQMKVARLSEGALATLAGGYIAGRVAPRAWWPIWFQGIVLVALFAPEHYALWQKFPIWYHLTFLGSLIPATLIGAWFARMGRGE